VKRIYAFLASLAFLTALSCAWIAYGSPLKEVVQSGDAENYDPSRAFFVQGCDKQGSCSISPQHQRVLHFSFGDGVMGYAGDIQGSGANPVAGLKNLGVDILPNPDFVVAALKWCSKGQIWEEFRTHGRHFIVELPNDPLATARCVQGQLPGNFDAYIADPMGRVRDPTTFDPS
jgi:hypothetical protein